jgi:hypothetical protein
MPTDWDIATTTLEEAGEWLLANMDDGADCPCCGQFCKVYRRAFNAAMARGLIWLVEKSPAGEWVDVPLEAPGWLTRSRELPKARYWGLIEEKPNVDPAKRCSGVWRPTDSGRGFVYEELCIPSHVYLFDNAVSAFEKDKKVSIRQALGSEFDYSELMQHPLWPLGSSRPRSREPGGASP